MVLNAFHKEIHLFANAHKDFPVKDAKTKCQLIHANRILVKTEVFARIKVVERMEWEEESLVNARLVIQAPDVKQKNNQTHVNQILAKMVNVFLWEVTLFVNVHQDFLDNVVKTLIHACLIHAAMEVCVFHKEVHLCVSAIKDFQDKDVRIKIHVNQIHVKTVEDAQTKPLVLMA